MSNDRYEPRQVNTSRDGAGFNVRTSPSPESRKNFFRVARRLSLVVGGLCLCVGIVVGLLVYDKEFKGLHKADQTQYVLVDDIGDIILHPENYEGKLVQLEGGGLVVASYSTGEVSVLYRYFEPDTGRTRFLNEFHLIIRDRDFGRQVVRGAESDGTVWCDFYSDKATGDYESVAQLLEGGSYTGRLVIRGRAQKVESSHLLQICGHSIDIEDANGVTKTFHLSDLFLQ